MGSGVPGQRGYELGASACLNGALMRRNHTKQTLNAFSLFEQQVPGRDRAIEQRRLQVGDCRLQQGEQSEREGEGESASSQARSLQQQQRLND